MKVLNIALKMPLLEILSWHTHYFWRDCCSGIIFDIFQRIFWLALIISLGFPKHSAPKVLFLMPIQTSTQSNHFLKPRSNNVSFVKLSITSALFSVPWQHFTWTSNRAIISFYFIVFRVAYFPHTCEISGSLKGEIMY